MKLKETKEVTVEITSTGEIVLQQYCQFLDEMVAIYLTLDQFHSIQKWVKIAEPNIEYAWNGGVEHDLKS